MMMALLSSEARDLEGAAREVREFAACRARPLPVVVEAPSPYVARRSWITRHVPRVRRLRVTGTGS